jgi:hypothetical protein
LTFYRASRLRYCCRAPAAGVHAAYLGRRVDVDDTTEQVSRVARIERRAIGAAS